MTSTKPRTFQLLETTISRIHAAFRSGELTARQLVEAYLARIEAFDRDGPRINSIITVNPSALADADAADAAFRASGFTGPLHGIPVIVKDQMDVRGTPTTMGSVLFKDYFPDRDSFVAGRLREAGAIILAKATLGELGGGDTHGTLFGSTRNPYDPERTVGGSSGGSAAAASANLATVALGQEGFASIRRPAAWNCVVGMRPTAGLVSRGGVYGGWPSRAGSVGPLTRTVEDLAKLLDVIVGYDPEDPLTAHGVGFVPASYTEFLDPGGLAGARIGILTEPMGAGSEPGSEDFARVTEVFSKARLELEAAGATLVDISIPGLDELLAKRASDGSQNDGLMAWLGRSANPPYHSLDELTAQPAYADYQALRGGARATPVIRNSGTNAHYEYLLAREELMTRFLKVMADNRLDVIVHKSVEHTPTLIRDGINPPFVNHKGAPHLNTFLIYVPSISVPAGFTSDGLPVGITFLGRPYSDASMVKYAYAYEQATHHRVPPPTTPALP
ncbi:MAG: hypothetical protein AMXMBFR80_18950 [Dehalococcoidia bacterium]